MLNKLQDIQQVRHEGTKDDAARECRITDLLLHLKSLSGLQQLAGVPVKS